MVNVGRRHPGTAGVFVSRLVGRGEDPGHERDRERMGHSGPSETACQGVVCTWRPSGYEGRKLISGMFIYRPVRSREGRQECMIIPLAIATPSYPRPYAHGKLFARVWAPSGTTTRIVGVGG